MEILRSYLSCSLLHLVAHITVTDSALQTLGQVPDEQRLYNDLMELYEPAVRPVLNANKTVIVNFQLSLNQIVDLDERKQVLTTNVFINQEWGDENLAWVPEDYNGIRTLRVPAAYVWLPDTFIFNNYQSADDGSTGFMQGVYVLLSANGSVSWPVPVKLRSSCKVDIMYFPFDDQQCILRFGSWIHSGEWMDFESSLESVDLTNYIDNSEWELLSIEFEKGVHTYACCPEPHPDLTYTLHIRRRTFFYVFNIIVPCVMLSVLTLLTFWLPTTSGEKISLGLSVFLAFSMFMLLIAEEVPATSESVPLIGIYLTTVMTMTSVSVIMAVMVINIYNRSSKARRAPQWLKVLVLKWICRLLRMSHDMERLASTIRLIDDEEEKYICPHHHLDIHTAECLCRHEEIVRNIESGRPPGHIHRTGSDVEELSRRFTGLTPSAHDSDEPTDPHPPDYEAATDCTTRNGFHSAAGVSSNSGVGGGVVGGGGADRPNRKESLIAAMASPIMTPVPSASAEEEEEEEEEVVWLRREEVNQEPLLKKYKSSLSPSSSSSTFHSTKQKLNKQFKQIQQHYRNHSFEEILPADDDHNHHVTEITNSTGLSKMPRRGILKRGGGNRRPRARAKSDHFARIVAKSCRREQSLALRKEIVVEWQTIATVIDRLLFWIFLLATVVAYLVILVFVPMTKPDFPNDMPAIHAFVRNTPPHS